MTWQAARSEYVDGLASNHQNLMVAVTNWLQCQPSHAVRQLALFSAPEKRRLPPGERVLKVYRTNLLRRRNSNQLLFSVQPLCSTHFEGSASIEE